MWNQKKKKDHRYLEQVGWLPEMGSEGSRNGWKESKVRNKKILIKNVFNFNLKIRTYSIWDKDKGFKEGKKIILEREARDTTCIE